MKYRVGAVALMLMLAFSMLAITACAEEIDGFDGEVVIADDDNVLVKITGFGEDPIWGFEMNVYLENKSDIDLTFSLSDVSINGYMNDPFWAMEVMAGSKANTSISWMLEEGDETTEEITQIEFTLQALDMSDIMAGPVFEQTYTVYPSGKDNAIIPERTPADSDIVLFDTDEVTAIVTGFRDDELWGYTADVYLENKTDKGLTFSVINATVNGYMCDPFWATEVAAGKRAYSSISWMDSSFEENGITEVSEIVLDFSVMDTDSFSTILSENVTVTP